MYKVLVICSLFLFHNGYSQEVIPLVDFNGYFKSFKNGFFRQVEFQRIANFKGGDNVVGYIDNRGNLRVYDGVRPMDLTNLEITTYSVSDNLLVWQVAETINMWDAGKKRTLTYNGRNFWVRDSVIVFEDLRYNSVNAYYNGEIYTLYTSVGDFDPPDFIGENIVAFRDNGNFYKVFWRGEIFDLDVWHNPFTFSGGTDILAFNDLITGTFAIFENGRFLDVEEFHVDTYKAGNGIVAYENLNGDLMYYGFGRKEKLANFGADWWDVKDGVVVWRENAFTYAYVDGMKYQIANYQPEEIQIKNEVVAFRNIMGGVSALIDGKIHEITNQMNSEFYIYGNSVLVKLFNNSYIVFQDGKKYTT